MPLRALATFLVLLIALNWWSWESAVFGFITGFVYLILLSYLLGGRLGKFSESLLERLIWGLVALCAIVGIVGSLIFYFSKFTPAVILGLILILPWLGKHEKQNYVTEKTAKNLSLWPLGIAYLALGFLVLLTLRQSQTLDAIRTPWAITPPIIFIIYALTSATFLLLARLVAKPAWLIPFYLITLSVLTLTYSLGYGFDPFIHQASEKLLAASGTISPKPFYYLGQYTVVVFLHQLLRLPITLIDTWLLPIIASLVLPFAFDVSLRNFKLPSPYKLLAAASPLLFTLPSLTYTTPQGLSNLFALIVILLLAARTQQQNVPLITVGIISLATLFIHPLTGLPLISIVILWWLIFEKPSYLKNFSKIAKTLATAACALIVPLAFFIFSWFKPGAASINFNPNILGNLEKLGGQIAKNLPFWPRFQALPDAIYLWGRPLTLILLILAGFGWWRAKKLAPGLRFFAWASALLTVSYLILQLSFYFPGLPSYEQNFYSIRLWDLALMCLLPLVLLGSFYGAEFIIKKLHSYLPIIVAGGLIFTASFYLTYPRFDLWHHDTAYNTTPADVEAVQLIAKTSGDTPYIVLSNQAVAAAAIKEFGFNKYYEGNFYYPLPTGTNPLYQVYLNATENGSPTRSVIEEASKIAKVSQVYLVINRYWADFLKLAPQAAKEANQSWKVADDRVQVFRYDF